MTPEISIFGQIGVDPELGAGMTAKAFDRQLKALGNPSAILLRINSPGGDVMDAMAIYSMIRNSKARVTARIEGIAASAASLIAMAANRIEIHSNAFMLIHQPWSQVSGSADDMASAAGDLQRMSDQFAKIYSARSGQPIEAVRELMNQDRLMNADEAAQLGYADAVIADGAEANMSMLPGKHRATIKAARRDRSHGWDTAIALATGKRKINLQRDAKINASWESALAKVNAERGFSTSSEAAGDGWDAVIRKTFGRR